LKSLRKHPGILHPGDVVVVPDFKMKQAPAATNRRHRFVAKVDQTRICLRFTCNGQAIRNEPYKLIIDGGGSREGSTDGDGKLDVVVLADAHHAQLTFPRRHEHHRIQLGALPPIERVGGQQARLRQLGFYPEEIDGKEGPLLSQALRAFQKSQKLTESGKPDAVTLQALATAYGH
jgi:hypothetical protein